jgi:hypothetical protein
MSRLKNFFRNLSTSYVQQSVIMVYSLVSIPLILHWLPNEPLTHCTELVVNCISQRKNASSLAA